MDSSDQKAFDLLKIDVSRHSSFVLGLLLLYLTTFLVTAPSGTGYVPNPYPQS